MEEKKTLCLDFDGVLHSYISGWQGAAIIPDQPVEGALDFVKEAAKEFEVVVHSARCHQEGGSHAVVNWLHDWGFLHYLKVADHKPSAWVYLDDRAMLFTGKFPSVKKLLEFRTWQKGGSPTETTISQLMNDSFRIAKEHGWHTPAKTFLEAIAKIHEEVSEACGEYSKSGVVTEIYYVETLEGEKPEGVPIELADACIRIAELCKYWGVDLERAILEKQAYNEKRPYRHGKVI